MSRPGKAKSQQNKPKGQEKPESWYSPFPLALDAAQIVDKHGDRCFNLGLWLDRFVSWTDRDERGRRAELQPAGDSKRRKCPPLKCEDGYESLELRERSQVLRYFDRRKEMLKAHTLMGFVVQEFQAQPLWRMVVGLGAESVLETSIRLHRIYGFPIIPGSAIKGLVRAYAELVLRKLPDDPELVSICGTSSGKTPLEAGKVIFFDAVPVNSPRLKLDVMNPHYGDYYRGGNNPPADYLSPKPVYFLTVESGSIFSFAVAAPSTCADLADKARSWLRDGLIELGVGAKTTAGYGGFEILSSV